jgi:DNA-directed RNA polymerase specialized sigma24 family protein
LKLFGGVIRLINMLVISKKTMETKMPALNAKLEREDLFREISHVLRDWPELDRRVFYQAHYQGQSPETISRLMQVDAQRVSAILRQCEDRLHAALKGFRRHAA